MADVIERLGIEFFSKVDKTFGDNVDNAIKQFQEKAKPAIQQFQQLFKNLAVTVSTAFNVLKDVPAINLVKMVDTVGLTDRLVGTFKDARTKSVAEFEKLNSEISGQVTKLKAEFGKLEKWTSELRAGENPVVDWGKTSFGKGGPYWPESKRAIDLSTEQTAPAGVVEAERQARITEYTQRQLQVYQQMVGLIGQMGAFEQARLATSELIAQRVQEETVARQKVAEFVGITKELLSRGLLAGGVDEAKLKSMKQYLDESIKTEEGRKVLNQELDTIMGKIVKDEQAIKDIILSSVSDKEKILVITKQIADQYEKIKSSSIGMTGGGAGGLGGGGVDWDMLIGKIQLAGAVVSQFQQKLQTIQLKAFINPDEFTRLSSIAQAINSEITDLTNKIARLGSQSVAREMARDWDVLRADIEKTGQAFKEAEALQKKGLPVTSVVDLDKAVYGLTARLKDLAKQGETVQLQALQVGLAKTNAEIQQLTGGVEINRKSLKQLGLGTLELEKLQGLLTERMKLIRQEFALTGKSTVAMNAAMESTGKSLGVVQFQAQQFTKRSADAARAMDRWGAGFVDMLKSQMAWLLGGALIFGTVFKIQQAFSEAIGTIFKFSQAIIDVGAITNASAADMKILEKAARDVATSTKMGFLEAADALKILGQAGLTAKESAEALKTVAMLVTATGASSQEAVKVLTTAMNVWKLSATESTRIGNVLAAALNYSKLEINDLATSFNYVAATAKQVGMSIEQTAATLAVLSNAGLRASTIGTGLRGILGQLIAPSTAFRKELDAIGVDFEDIRMPGNNLIDILGLLEKKGFDLTSIFEGLEKRQAGVFASMRDMGPAALQRMTDALTGTNAMLVMNERAMEGPMNQLHVFKTRLLDVALSLSDIVVPSFNLLLKGLGGLVETFKMFWPVFIGVGVIGGIVSLIKHFDLLTTATTRLGLSLIWLQAHPVIAALTLLAVTATAVKLAYDALNKSNEDHIKQIDREVMLYAQQAGELETLRTKLKTVKMSQEEMKDAVNNLSGEYTELREIINKVGFTHGQITDQVLKDIDEWYKKIDSLKLDRLKLVLDDLETIHKKIDEARAKYKALQEQKWEVMTTEVGGFVVSPATKGQLLDANKNLLDLLDTESKLTKSANDTGRAFKDKTEEVLRGMLKEKQFGEKYIRTALDARKQAIQEEKSMQQKALDDNQKARLATMRTTLYEMRKELTDEEGKIRLAYQEGMQKFPDKGYADTKEGIEAARVAAEGRAAVQATYDRKMRALSAKERNVEVQEELKIEEAGLRDSLALASKESDMRERIQKETHIKQLLELLQWQKEMERIRYEVATGAIRASKGKELQERARTQYFDADIKLQKQASFELSDYEEKQRQKGLVQEKQDRNEMRRIREENARALIAIAKTVRLDVSAQEEITRVQREDEEDKHLTKITQINTEHLNEMGELNRAGVALIYAETERYKNKLIALEEEGNRNIEETGRKWDKKRLDDIEKKLTLEADASTRADQIILKSKQAQYDSLAEIDRTSEFGKKLKYDIDLATKSISEDTIVLYQNTVALLKSGEQTDATKLLIVKFNEEIDRLTDKSRTATRAMSDWEGTRTLWQGLEAGVKKFGQSLETNFQFGMKLSEDFGKTLQQAIAEPLDDLFTNKLKTWAEYQKSFFNNMGLMFSKVIQQMLWEWIGFNKSTSGTTGGLGSILGWFGKLLGIGGGIKDVPVGNLSAGEMDQMIWLHGGGPVKKMHEGGLQRDEVIARLLTNEAVLNRKATRGIGEADINYMNREGRMPSERSIIVTPPEVKIVNLIDPRQVVAQALRDQPNLIINPIFTNAQLVNRILAR